MRSSPADTAAVLGALRDVSRTAPAAAAWCRARGLPEPAGWERTYGRHRPGAEPWAVLVLEGAPASPGAPLVLAMEFGDAGIDHPLVRSFADDPALPGIGIALSELEDVEVLRYRPGMRCTMRGRACGRTVIAKIAPAARNAGDDARALWEAHLAGLLPFAVAEPLRWDPGTGTLWQGLVPGRPILEDVLSVDGPALSRRLGAVLAGLARADVRPAGQAPAAGQLERTDRAVRRAAARVPGLSGRLHAAAAWLRATQESLPEVPLVPCHGAAHPHQWLLDGRGLGLIDFDRFALGEPELDVATYVAELETERGLLRGADVHEAAMLEGFCDGGVPLDPRRVWLHRQHKRIAKITRTAMALRPDGPERAAALLGSLEDALGGGSPAA